MPIWLDGAQLTYQNTSDLNYTPFCEAILSHLRPSGFRFGMFAATSIEEDLSRAPFLIVDLNPTTLSTNICLQYHLAPSVRFQWKAQTRPTISRLRMTDLSTRSMLDVLKRFREDGIKNNENTISIEWFGPATTVSFNTYVAAGRSTISCLQNFTPSLTLGKELLIEWDKDDVVTKLALAARYNHKCLTAAATYSMDTGDFDVTLWRQIYPYLQLGTSVVYHGITKRAISTMFCQKDYEDCIFRGMVDSESSIGFTYDRYIRNLGTFGISLLWCVCTNRFLCGFKLDMESIAPLTNW